MKFRIRRNHKISKKKKNKPKKQKSNKVYIDNILNIPNPIPGKYSLIPQIPPFQLQPSHMLQDPIQLVLQLQKTYKQYGAIHLITPNCWKPPFCFGKMGVFITTRSQILQNFKKGKVRNFKKAFVQNLESYDTLEFQQMAKSFQENYDYVTDAKGQTLEEVNEQQFWNIVNNPQSKNALIEYPETEVQYGADLSVLKYGSGFPLSKCKNQSFYDYTNSLFNLNNLNKSSNSLLKKTQEIKLKISGITSPWVYLGMKFATFCWHVEDLFMHSISYNHKGHIKTWYIIPPSDKQKFDKFVEQKYKNFKKKKEILFLITLLIDPLQIMNAGIKVYKINQKAGHYAITLPKSYHAGFSHGFNVAQAVNFMTINGLPLSIQALKQYVQKKKSPVFPMEWVVFNCIHNQKYKDNIKYYKNIVDRYKKSISKLLDNGKIKGYKLMTNPKYDRKICKNCKDYSFLIYFINKCVNCLCMQEGILQIRQGFQEIISFVSQANIQQL